MVAETLGCPWSKKSPMFNILPGLGLASCVRRPVRLVPHGVGAYHGTGKDKDRLSRGSAGIPGRTVTGQNGTLDSRQPWSRGNL